MGLGNLINRLFAPPAPSKVIERYLESGRSRWIDELFDGWVELDDDTYARLMTIHERHGGGGFYGGLLQPEARDDLKKLTADLRRKGK